MRFPKALVVVLFTVASALAAAAPVRAEVQITIVNGRISLVAKDATLRQILAEWARVGQTQIVNGERVPGGPITLQLTDVTEEQALDTLLRSLSGYVAAPRASVVAGVSRFDRIIVMPTVAPPISRTAAAPAPAPVFPPANNPLIMRPGQPAQMGRPLPMLPDEQPDEDVTGANPNPAFNVFPQPQVPGEGPGPNGPMPGGLRLGIAPGQGPVVLPPPNAPASASPPMAYPAMPTIPPGVAVPGMVAPAPKQPGPQGQQPASSPQQQQGEPR